MHENGSRQMKFSGKGVLSITSIPENVPRIPVVRAIFAAKKKPVEKIEGIAGSPMGVSEISVEIPKMESVCEFLPLDDMNETSKILLRQAEGGAIPMKTLIIGNHRFKKNRGACDRRAHVR